MRAVERPASEAVADEAVEPSPSPSDMDAQKSRQRGEGTVMSRPEAPMLAQPVREDFVAAAVRPEFQACIRGLLADHLGVDAERIAAEVSLVEDLAADASAAALAWVRGQFPRLGDRGVALDVRRHQRLGMRRPSAA